MQARKLVVVLVTGAALIAGSGAAAAGKPLRNAYSTAGGATAAAPADTVPQAAPGSDRGARYTDATAPETANRQIQQQAVRPLTVTPDSAEYSIYDAHVVLLRDDDADGFYHRFEVVFDADTYYFSADVYARLYLSYQGGPYYHYYTTDTFVIDGSASDDEYEVNTTLTTGYPPGYYAIAIDLYEAGSHRLVASTDPYADADLAALPLEDLGYESGGSAGVSLFTGIVLLEDRDYDGYFHRFALDIDVDMPGQSQLVYARIDVRVPHGAWLHEHTTAGFLVDGTGPHDILRVNGDWESGYPPGRYDFRVGVYDAHTHALLVENGPASLSLTGVPLEDAIADSYVNPPPPPLTLPSPGHGHTISHGHGGSSATGLWALALLSLGLLVRVSRWRGRVENF